jgi:hypothetical protein
MVEKSLVLLRYAHSEPAGADKTEWRAVCSGPTWHSRPEPQKVGGVQGAELPDLSARGEGDCFYVEAEEPGDVAEKS